MKRSTRLSRKRKRDPRKVSHDSGSEEEQVDAKLSLRGEGKKMTSHEDGSSQSSASEDGESRQERRRKLNEQIEDEEDSSSESEDGESRQERRRKLNEQIEDEEDSSSESEEEESRQERRRKLNEQIEDEEDSNESEEEESMQERRRKLNEQVEEGSSESEDEEPKEESSQNPNEQEEDDEEEEPSSSDEEQEEDDGESSKAESEEEEESTVELLRETLRELPLSKLAKLKRDGINGKPLHRALGLPSPESIGSWLDGTFKEGASEEHLPKKKRKLISTQPLAKKSRNAPVELTSKRPVSKFRHVVTVPRVERRDPRFEAMSGSLDANVFDKRYKFLDDYREKEIQELDAAIKKDKKLRMKPGRSRRKSRQRPLDDRERTDAVAQLTKLKQDRAIVSRERTVRDLKRDVNKKERDMVAKGKKAFYVKKRDFRKLELEKRFEQLDKTGKIDKYMEKKRKKQASKERRYLPPKA